MPFIAILGSGSSTNQYGSGAGYAFLGDYYVNPQSAEQIIYIHGAPSTQDTAVEAIPTNPPTNFIYHPPNQDVFYRDMKAGKYLITGKVYQYTLQLQAWGAELKSVPYGGGIAWELIVPEVQQSLDIGYHKQLDLTQVLNPENLAIVDPELYKKTYGVNSEGALLNKLYNFSNDVTIPITLRQSAQQILEELQRNDITQTQAQQLFDNILNLTKEQIETFASRDTTNTSQYYIISKNTGNIQLLPLTQEDIEKLKSSNQIVLHVSDPNVQNILNEIRSQNILSQVQESNQETVTNTVIEKTVEITPEAEKIIELDKSTKTETKTEFKLDNKIILLAGASALVLGITYLFSKRKKKNAK